MAYSLYIYSNTNQLTDVLIKDMGIIIPNSGGYELLELTDEIQQAIESQDLRDYLTDDAHNPNGSTLILATAVGIPANAVPEADALDYLDNLLNPSDAEDNYSVVKRDGSGEVVSDLTTNAGAPNSLVNWGLDTVSLVNDLDADGNQISNLAQADTAGEAVEYQQWFDQLTKQKVWREVVLHADQLQDGAAGVGGVAQAIAFFLDNQAVANDTLVIDDGVTTETFTFKAAEAAPFDVGIGVDVDTTMANLVQAINDDSTLWSASLATELDSINDGSGTSTAGLVAVIYRTAMGAAVDSYDDRIYSSGANNTQADWVYVNFNGEVNYLISTNSQLPSADPAQKEFGIGYGYNSLVPNQTHRARNEDHLFTWDDDTDTWIDQGSLGVVYGITAEMASPGLHATTNNAGVLDKAARIDHVHAHGDLSGTDTVHHDDTQTEASQAYPNIGTIAGDTLDDILSAIDDLIGQAGAVNLQFGASRRVPLSGTRYLGIGVGVVSSAAEYRCLRTGTITGASIQLDAAVNAARTYDLVIYKNGVSVETVALAGGVQGAHDVTLNTAVAAGDLISVAVVRTGGAGRSDFNNMAAAVEINY